APDAAGARFELLHDLVAVARLLLDEQQDRGADVAAADAPAAAHAAEAGRAGEAHREHVAGAAAPGAARAGTVLAGAVAEEDEVFLVVVHECSFVGIANDSAPIYR